MKTMIVIAITVAVLYFAKGTAQDFTNNAANTMTARHQMLHNL